LLGVKNEEIKGKTDYDIITKELADYNRANDQKVIEEGKPISIEEEANLVDGHHTFIANKFPIYDNNNKLYGVGSVSTDITELKKTEENLKESEERLRLSQTLGNVGIWDWNTITDELHFTPELEQLYGLIPRTIKTYQDWRQLTHPDDIEKIEAERDDKIANQEPFDLEFRIFHKSGDIRWLSAKGGAIYNNEGNIVPNNAHKVAGFPPEVLGRLKSQGTVIQKVAEKFDLAEPVNGHRAAVYALGQYFNVLFQSSSFSPECRVQQSEKYKAILRLIGMMTEKDPYKRPSLKEIYHAIEHLTEKSQIGSCVKPDMLGILKRRGEIPLSEEILVSESSMKEVLDTVPNLVDSTEN